MTGDAKLFILATVHRLGEAHGHEITREAMVDHLERWAHVSQGALYAALRKCEVDGLIAPVRREQIGNYPARTVYRLTDAGRDALDRVRSAAWERTGIPSDPFDLALSVSDGLAPARIAGVIERRIAEYESSLEDLRAEFARLDPDLEPTARAVFEHQLLRHETEVSWHRQLLGKVDTFGTRRMPTGERE